jgi:hypothetical protein
MDCENLEFKFLNCMKKMGKADDKCKNEFDRWFQCNKIDFTTCSADSRAPSTQPWFKEKASPQTYIPCNPNNFFMIL